MDKLDFKNLSWEQEKIVQEIFTICEYFHHTRKWVPRVSDDVLARQAREIGLKMEVLTQISRK